MDVAYDHVQEEALPEHKDTPQGSEAQDASSADLRSELSQTYQAFSQSAWGTRLGGFWASARKQVCHITSLMSSYSVQHD